MSNSRQHLKTPAIALLSLSIMTQSPATAATYAESMARVQSYLRANRVADAESALRSIDRQFQGNSEVRALQMRLACRRAAFEEGLALRLPVSSSKDLQEAVLYCTSEQQYAKAQSLMAQQQPDLAIAVLLPMVQHDKDGYRAGLALAQAYLANHQPDQAEALFSELAQRYPSDAAELRQQAERLRDDRLVAVPQASLALSHPLHG